MERDARQERTASVVDAFLRAVERFPRATALVEGDAAYTYEALAARAARLAAGLAGEGIAAGSLVPIAIPRSAVFVAACLAVLERGAAYVPIDLRYPREYVRRIFRDCGADVAIVAGSTPESLVEALRSLGVRLLDSDALLARGGGAESAYSPGPDGVAYAMYTSGSTGAPKGVLVPHRAIVRLVVGSTFARMGPDEVWLHHSSPAFDAATLETWAPLLNGGRCVVLAGVTMLTVRGLREAVSDQGVTSLWLTATHFNALVDEDPSVFRGARQVLVGGEALSLSHVGKAMEACPDVAFINGYGPTENTTFTCTHRIVAADLRGERGIPIGTPVDGTTVFVLDEELREVPRGTVGELCAGGAGVALGYLRRPEASVERFIAHPLASPPSHVLYRTGDLVRQREDGVIEFVGRRDRQVKLRGFRLELAEIERQLDRLDPVLESAVVVRRDAAGSDRLVAYVRLREGAALDAAALEARLLEQLPPYAVPRPIVAVVRFPTTVGGKLDRDALPDPGALAPRAPRDGAAPRDETERRVLEVWRDVLGDTRLGMEDDFVHAGGHSLRALRIAARVERALGVPLAVHEVLAACTARGLAALVERARGVAAPVVPPVARDRPIPLTAGQLGLWLEHRLDPDDAAFHVPLAVRLSGRLDRTALGKALADLVRRHEALRSRFVDDSEDPGQVVDEGPATVLETREERGRTPAQIREILAAESRRPFDLARGPPYRFVLVATGEAEYHLLLVFHHVAIDEWSLDVLLRELGPLYAAALAGAPATLAPATLQMPDAAAWLRAHESASPPAAVAMAGDDAGLPSPTAPVEGPVGMRIEADLPENLAARIAQCAAAEGATPFQVALAAFMVLVHRLTGRDRVVVGTPRTLREGAAFEGLVGYLLEMVPVVTIVEGRPTFRDVLGAIRTCLRAPAATPSAGAGRRPFDVVFVFLHDPADRPNFPGIEATPVPVWAGHAKYALTVEISVRRGRTTCAVEFRRDRLRDDVATTLANEYTRVLDALLGHPERPIADAPLASEAGPGGGRDSLARARRDEPPFPRSSESRSVLPSLERLELASSPPLTPHEVRLRRIWCDLLGTDAIGAEDSFVELGGTSLLAIRMVARVEKEFGGRVPVRAVLTAPTLRRLALEIERRPVSALPSAVVRLQEHPTGTPLFCIPGAGGHVFSYQALVDHLPRDLPVYGLQIQELSETPEVLDSVERLATELLRQVRVVQPTGPYALVGYSFGGSVAFEMARQLEAAGEGGGLLVLIDAYPSGALTEQRGRLAKLRIHLDNLSQRSLREKWSYVVEKLSRRFEKKDADAGVAARKDSLEARVAFVESRCRRAYFAWSTGRYAGPITILRARLNEWFIADPDDETGGWRRFVSGRMETTAVRCEHRQVFDAPNIAELGRVVYEAYLAHAGRRGAAGGRGPDPRAGT